MPPFGSNTMVYVGASSHWAYKVRLVQVMLVPGAYRVPGPSDPVPLACVFHPMNVYPVRVGTVVDSVTFPDMHV